MFTVRQLYSTYIVHFFSKKSISSVENPPFNLALGVTLEYFIKGFRNVKQNVKETAQKIDS